MAILDGARSIFSQAAADAEAEDSDPETPGGAVRPPGLPGDDSGADSEISSTGNVTDDEAEDEAGDNINTNANTTEPNHKVSVTYTTLAQSKYVSV